MQLFRMSAARMALWVTTLGSLALALKSWVSGPPSMSVALLWFGGYLCLCCLGFFFPRWEMYAEVVQRGSPGKKRIALTFDDGPSPSTTPRVLAALASYGFRATFFVIGSKAERHPDLMTAIVGAGHELGVHGYTHHRLTAFRSASFMRRDLRRVIEQLTRWVPTPPLWYRPPVGHLTPTLAAVVAQHDLTVVCWDVRALDGLAGARPDRVARRVLRRCRDGSIVLLHDASEKEGNVPAGVQVLETILKALSERGLRSVTLSELLGTTGVHRVPAESPKNPAPVRPATTGRSEPPTDTHRRGE